MRRAAARGRGSVVIDVLRSGRQVDEAVEYLRSRAVPLHGTRWKNWDHALLLRRAEALGADAAIADLGSGHGHTLDALHAAGQRSLTGIDLQLQRSMRLRRLAWSVGLGRFRPAFLIRQGDLTRTGLPTASVELASCISVVEHGVDLEGFYRECARILRPGGRLLVTTDYWPEKVEPRRPIELFGLPWRVFDAEAVEAMIRSAAGHGLHLQRRPGDLDAGERVVSFEGLEYTFIALDFERAA